MSPSSTELQLQPDSWFGWQMLPGYQGSLFSPYVSPIRVDAVTARKTGRRILGVAFRNVFYAEGVQDFRVDMRILKHEADYLVAELLDDNGSATGKTAVISHIEFEWVRRFCPALWSEQPPQSLSPAARASVSRYLDEIYGGR